MNSYFPYASTKRRLGESAGYFKTPDGAWVLDFHYPRDPLPMNGSRGHWRSHQRKVRGVKLRTWRNLQLAAIPPLERCEVQLTWYVVTGHRRDVENLTQTLKVMCDTLVEFGIVADDTPNLMRKLQNDIVRVDPLEHGEAWMELSIRPWAGRTEVDAR